MKNKKYIGIHFIYQSKKAYIDTNYFDNYSDALLSMERNDSILIVLSKKETEGLIESLKAAIKRKSGWKEGFDLEDKSI